MRDTAFYDELAETYDLMISWKSRLRRERSFFRQVFRQYRVGRILDTACGTGMHSIAFHDWGYYVEGADISPRMIRKARENAGERRIRFVRAGFTDVEKINGMYDAVTCLGNSLPHVLTDEKLGESLRAMYDLLVPGGVLIIHGNNYDRILGRRERFMPLTRVRHGKNEYLFLRFFDLRNELLDFNVLSLAKELGVWKLHTQKTEHRALTKVMLTAMLRESGFSLAALYGGFSFEPFEKRRSNNLIVVAQKPHTRISDPPREPVAALDRVPIRENGDTLVDVAAVLPEVETRRQPTYARRTVVEMLRKAQSMLPIGCRLRVSSGYRSLSHQKEIYERYLVRLQEEHPSWPSSRLRREANKFLAPPDAIHPPGHATGGAVDVQLIGPDGKDLDMSSTIRPNVPVTVTFPTYSREITPAAAKNRETLVKLMSAAGFSNFAGEWWHWSFGDSAWAVRTGHPYAIYGAAEAPEADSE